MRLLLNGLAIAAIATIAPATCAHLPRADDPALNKGGLTILSYNDLTSKDIEPPTRCAATSTLTHADNPPKDSAGILVHEPLGFTAFSSLCPQLGEKVWNPDSASFGRGLNSSLKYQVFQQNFKDDQVFWITKSNTTAEDTDLCRAINAQGQVSGVLCTEKLPGICTQSAPVSNQTTNNEPTTFHINHGAAGQLYTGFRDFFVWKFRGVRYAAQPPRFEHSTVFKANASEPVPALRAGAECLQPIGEVREGMSEDCFFLNIWTPWLPPSGGAPKLKLKPVMFYIYGGGFTSGSGKNPNTDGTNIASRGDVVAVSTNYRVSNLGHLNLNDGVHNGNYGLGDIITALAWVKEHIAAFGGDATRITVYGESAGAVAVRALLASPKAKGLFSTAISQSGPAGLTGNEGGFISHYDSLAYDYNTTTTKVLEETGCAKAKDALECLRQYNATELVNLKNVARGLIQDGQFLNVTHLPLDGSGLTKDVVIMTGTNRDELGVEFDMPSPNSTVSDVMANFAGRFGVPVAGLTPLTQGPFPVPPNPSPADLLNLTIRLGTDGVYTCAEQATSFSAVRHSAFEAVYSFMFNRTYNPSGYTKPHCGPSPSSAFPNGDPEHQEYFKCHAGEQMVVFGTIQRDGLPDRDGLDVPFMQLVMDYWTSFARNGNPNPSKEYLEARGYWSTLEQIGDVGPWNPATKDVPNLRLLQWDGRHINHTEVEQCKALGMDLDFWEDS
jgi:carboxylesterase type B